MEQLAAVLEIRGSNERIPTSPDEAKSLSRSGSVGAENKNRQSSPQQSDGDMAMQHFPLNDIDYESSPAAVAQELSTLQTIQRWCMDVDSLKMSADFSGNHPVQSELNTAGDLKHASGPMSSVDLDSDYYNWIFALEIVDRLNLDLLDDIPDREEAQLIIQESLEFFSYSLEWEDRDHRLHLQTQVHKFFPKHGP
jgi:hypothetical protein